MTDLLIIGAGPAALTAALYAARAGLSTVVYDKQHFGGALTEMAEIANFPGFTGSGAELAEQLKNQAQAAGAKIEYGECSSVKAESVLPERVRSTASTEATSPVTTGARKRSGSTDSAFTAIIDDVPISAHAVLVATGTTPRAFDLAALGLQPTKPISYCALCDAPLYQGKSVLVLGGGNSAVGEALYLADIVKSLTLVNRSPLRAEQQLTERLRQKENVQILAPVTLTQDLIDQHDAIFVFIGKDPATSFLPASVLDQDGYVVTDQDYQTTIPGLFAAGDVRAGAIRQAITAAGEGAAAAIKIIDYLKSR